MASGLLWVGVKCDREIARAREALRPDRVPAMADSQAALAHEGVVNDMTLDTSHASAESWAAQIRSRVSSTA